jgi:hypothetical protein
LHGEFRRVFTAYVFFAVALCRDAPSGCIANNMIDPLEILLHSSEPLRRAAQSNDPVELKCTLLSLAIEFDELRALMPTPSCVALDDLQDALKAEAARNSQLPTQERAG